MLDLTDAERTAFDAAGLVGDLRARFLDAEGRALSGPADDRVLAVTLDDLAAITTVVRVAAGREKRPGTLGAAQRRPGRPDLRPRPGYVAGQGAAVRRAGDGVGPAHPVRAGGVPATRAG